MENKPRYKVIRCGYIVIDGDGIIVSPEFATHEEALNWIKEKKHERK